MGLDELHLMVLSASSEDPAEQANATKGVKLVFAFIHMPTASSSCFASEWEALGARRESYLLTGKLT